MVKSVAPSWLSEKVQSNDILVLDTRDINQYSAGYISGAVHICCTGLNLRRLKKGTVCVESLLLCAEAKSKYDLAKVSERVGVIVIDQSSPSAEQLPADSVAALLLKKLSRECMFVGFLAGGYQAFSRNHPSLCLKAGNAVEYEESALTRRPSSLVLQLSNLKLNVRAVNDEQSSPSDESDQEDRSPTDRDHVPYPILPHLYLGCRKVASSFSNLVECGITRILNCTSSVPNKFEHLDRFTYHQIAVEDSHDVDMIARLPEAFEFIEDARVRGQKVLVHCNAGISRSATVIIAYLMKYYAHTVDTAFEFVKERKSNISPNFSFMGQLVEFECNLRPSPSDSGIGSSGSSPMEGCFLPFSGPPSVPVDFSRPFVLAA